MVAFIKKLFQLNTLSILVLGLMIMAFSGCATLDVTLPITDLESPQHQGRKSGFGVEFSGLSAKQLQLNDDPSNRPVDLTGTKHKVSNLFLTKTSLNYYFWERFSLSGTLIDSKTPAAKLKISLMGFREDAQPGTFLASLNFMGSYQLSESSGNQNGAGGPVGYPWKGKGSLVSGTAGLSFGYQFFKKSVPFIGINYQEFQTSGQIDHTAVPSVGDAGGSYKIGVQTGKIITYGIGLDIRPNPRFYFMPQIYMYKFNWYENEINDIGGSFKLVYVPVQ